jgi:hypothetical protein
MINANIIPLEFWKDPQSDVIVIFSERECSVYFSCWTSAGEPADFIGKLSFNGAAAVRSLDHEFNPYQYEGSFRFPILIWSEIEWNTESDTMQKPR